MIRYRQGDLFASGLPALAHGVNCRGAMGAGIARSFRERWPDMYEDYRQICAAGHLRPGQVFAWKDATGLVIVNLATQKNTGADAKPWAVATAIGQMIMLAQELGITEVGLPLIGCGIGGLKREDLVVCLAPFEVAPVNLSVYEYVPPAPVQVLHPGRLHSLCHDAPVVVRGNVTQHWECTSCGQACDVAPEEKK